MTCLLWLLVCYTIVLSNSTILWVFVVVAGYSIKLLLSDNVNAVWVHNRGQIFPSYHSIAYSCSDGSREAGWDGNDFCLMQSYKREVKNTSSCDLNVACSMQDSAHNGMFARKHCIILLDKCVMIRSSSMPNGKNILKGTLSQVLGNESEHIEFTWI